MGLKGKPLIGTHGMKEGNHRDIENQGMVPASDLYSIQLSTPENKIKMKSKFRSGQEQSLRKQARKVKEKKVLIKFF